MTSISIPLWYHNGTDPTLDTRAGLFTVPVYAEWRTKMLNESSYEFVNPGEDFYWYGMPMPRQDEDNVQACPSEEDIAYLVEWNMDMRAMVSYGYVGS